MPDPDLAHTEVSRRTFLTAAGAGAIGLAGTSVLGRAAYPGGTPPGANLLQTAGNAVMAGTAARLIPFNNGWLFGGLYTAGSRQPGFGDSQFTDVTLPHCVTPLSWRDWNYGTWEKVWIYRRHFDLPPEATNMRTFVEFTGALTSALPIINGRVLGGHQGGYLPFTYELTDYLSLKGNVLAVELNSTWQNVPPEGNPAGPTSIDYLEPGGLHRDAWLRVVPQIFISDVFAKPVNVLTSSPQVQIECTVDAAVAPSAPMRLEATLFNGSQMVSQTSAKLTINQAGQVNASLELSGFGGVHLWSPDNPHLYEVVTTLFVNDQPVHDFTRRIGFREAIFAVDGFFLNGTRLKLFGLNRHQVFPYTGMAMPARVQRRDALILKQQLNCNMVRCSHYPQSPYFLDACDELGIMVWEETPGWGYLGDAAWQELMLQNVHDMVVRDRSRPSVIIWGVEPNETPHSYTSLFTQSKDLADSLDGSRPTSGTSWYGFPSGFVFDVMACDDYGQSNGNATLRPPFPGVPYLVTEAVGAIDGARAYQWTDTQAIQQEQAMMHGQVHNIAGSENGYSGLLGWSAFDYDSDDGIYENLKQTGVADTFRVLKPGAAIYRAQVSPSVKPVIEPSFYWCFGTESPVTSLGQSAMIWSNCERIEAYLNGSLFASLTPAANQTSPGPLQGYPYLLAPPFYLDVSGIDGSTLPELRLDGYVDSHLVLSRSFSADTAGDYLEVTVDDTDLVSDGSDATRVAFRAVDRFGAPRPYAGGDVTVSVDGPGSYVGKVATLAVTAQPNLLSPGQSSTVTATLTNGGFAFGVNGGVGAVWIRTLPDEPGLITVRVTHPILGSGQVQIRSTPTALSSPGGPSSLPVEGPGEIGLVLPGGTTMPVAAPLPVVPALGPGHASRGGQVSPADMTDVTLTLPVPPGWGIRATSPTTFPVVAPGVTVQVTWTVTAPGDMTPSGSLSLAVNATFTIQAGTGSEQVVVPVAFPVSLASAYDNIGISDDSDVASITTANFDGNGNSYSEQALTAAGLAPGATVTYDGIAFTWPDVAAGQPDNVLAEGQTILVSGSGATLGFLGASSPGDEGGTGTVYYTDGTTSTYYLTLDNYFYPPDTGNGVVATLPYINDSNPAFVSPPGKRDHVGYIFYAGVPVTPGKALQAVTLPTGGSVVSNGRVTGAHIFAIGIG